MIDGDTFLPILYVLVDDFCQSGPRKQVTHPGPQAALSCSEVVTLAVFGQWAQFPSERAFYRYAESHLRAAFPTLPHRSQFNRSQQQHAVTITAFALHLDNVLDAQHCTYERLDSSDIPTRDTKRRGTGWLRIASQKSFFVRCEYLLSSASFLVFPPRLNLRSSALEQERNTAYVTEKKEDVS